MKKNIIISGPKASGKTHIARAIAITHSPERVKTINQYHFWEEMGSLDNGRRCNCNTYDLLIIDGCLSEDISEFEIQHRTLPFKDKITFVYTTQDTDLPEHIRKDLFHIIDCNNRHINPQKLIKN